MIDLTIRHLTQGGVFFSLSEEDSKRVINITCPACKVKFDTLPMEVFHKIFGHKFVTTCPICKIGLGITDEQARTARKNN